MIIIIHYSEIGLKGGNRAFFERQLMHNIKRALKDFSGVKVRRMSGRLEVSLSSDKVWIKARKKLKKVFGIANFSPAKKTEQKLAVIQKEVLSLLRERRFKTFAVRAKRSEKSFPLKSMEIEKEVGAYLLNKLKNKKVNLRQPDITCYVEIVEKSAFVYLEKVKGAGGLPVGSTGKVAVLLSGGFDSPVAAWQITRRGAEVVFVHFHSYPNTSRASLEKVKKLAGIFADWQPLNKLYLIPFLEIQKEIIGKAPAKLRVILYRRQMLKIAALIAGEEQALALATGDSLGQVASQTLENIRAISAAVDLPIFRPLIGRDKEEIINLAKKISTYKISSEPFDDCCSLFVPKHPETRADLKVVLEAEKKLLLDKKIKTALARKEILRST